MRGIRDIYELLLQNEVLVAYSLLSPVPFLEILKPNGGISFLCIATFCRNFDRDEWNTLQKHSWRHACKQPHRRCMSDAVYSFTKQGLSLSLNHKDCCLSFEWCMRRYEVQEFPVVAIHIFVPCVSHHALPTFTSYLLEYWGARRRCVTQQWRHFQGDTVFIILMKSVLPHAVSRISFSLWAVGITKIACFMCRVGFAFSEQLSRCSSMVV